MRTLGSKQQRSIRTWFDKHRSDRLWQLAALCLLLASLTGSAVGGLAWANYQSGHNARSFDAAALGVASTVNTEIRRDVDFDRSFGNLVKTSPDKSNSLLGAWLEASDLHVNYPGTLGIGFVERVPLDQLATFEASLARDPVPGEKTVSTVYPPGSRSSYCLLRYGLVFRASQLPPGTDMCASSYPGFGRSFLPKVLDEATTSGKNQMIDMSTAVPGTRELKGELNDFIIVSPVYRQSTMPTTSTERQSSLIGWIVGTFDQSSLVPATVSQTRGLSLTVESHGTALTSEGPAPGHGWLTVTRNLTAGPGLSIVVARPAATGPVTQGIVLGLLGGLFGSFLFAFAAHLGRSRSRALRLVAQRTDELHHQAMYDILTDLPNRALLFDRAEQMLLRARRNASSVGALFVDLDNFKDVNDSFGHHAGDQLLQSVAARLKACARATDTVGRLGGDEFLVLTEDDGSEDGAGAVAGRIIAALEEPFLLDASGLPITIQASVGVATGSHTTAEELIGDADIALYRAKETGKGRHVRFQPEMRAALEDRLTLEMDLRAAIERKELFVLYQPIFGLGAMKTTRVEALVRWQHPVRGIISPLDFIPVAEQCGLIVPIGNFVLDRACGQATEWLALGHDVGVSVNVSVVQVESDLFLDEVRSALARHGLAPEYLTLEITESVLMQNTTASARVLDELKSIGVHIAVDDFGTGYSSLAYLQQFPIDSIKIDRSFVGSVNGSPQGEALVDTLLQLGRTLGIETLAEGIESEAQLAYLRREGCQSGQGFLFARPLPPSEVESFLSTSLETL